MQPSVPVLPGSATRAKVLDDTGHHICRPNRCRLRPRDVRPGELPRADGRRCHGRCRRRQCRRPAGCGRRRNSGRGPFGRRLEPSSPPSCWRPACRSPIPSRTGRWPRPRRPAWRSSATSSCSAASGPGASPDAPFIAITGTNGKSTTTALIAHILRAGRQGRADGRQHRHGHPGALQPPAADRIHVIEMSSFQIELTPSLEPSIGVLLNVSPDHLDRHGTMEHYAALKARLVQAAKHPIIGEDDDWCRDISERLRLANRSWVDIVSAISRVVARLVRQRHRAGQPARRGQARSAPSPTSPASASLRGRHNIQNALAASAARLHSRRRAGAKWRPRWQRSPACRIGWRRSAAWAHALHQRQQGHQRRQRRDRARRLRPRHLLDPGRQAEAGRHRRRSQRFSRASPRPI